VGTTVGWRCQQKHAKDQVLPNKNTHQLSGKIYTSAERAGFAYLPVYSPLLRCRRAAACRFNGIQNGSARTLPGPFWKIRCFRVSFRLMVLCLGNGANGSIRRFPFLTAINGHQAIKKKKRDKQAFVRTTSTMGTVAEPQQTFFTSLVPSLQSPEGMTTNLVLNILLPTYSNQLGLDLQ
jgi:hypothetical protein